MANIYIHTYIHTYTVFTVYIFTLYWIHISKFTHPWLHTKPFAEFMQTYSEVTETTHFATIYGSQACIYDGKLTFMYLKRPYVTSKIHVIYVITFLSLSAEVRGYLFRFFWPHAKGVSTENDLINVSIWRFPTRTAQIQASLRWRRERNRHFSINWVVWASVLSHPSSRIASSDWAELAPPVCKLANTYRPISHHSQ